MIIAFSIQATLSTTFFSIYLEDLLYYYQPGVGNQAYYGQVLLHPSFEHPSPGNAAVSMGMVGVKEEGDGCNYWRFIEITSHVDLTLANTLCRQMGFTHVSAVLSRKDAEEIFGINFWFRNALRP